jgi:hypothetical protein
MRQAPVEQPVIAPTGPNAGGPRPAGPNAAGPSRAWPNTTRPNPARPSPARPSTAAPIKPDSIGQHDERSGSSRQVPATRQAPATRQRPAPNQAPATRQRPAPNQAPATRQRPATRQTARSASATQPHWELRAEADGRLTAILIGMAPPIKVTADDLPSLRKKIRTLILRALL